MAWGWRADWVGGALSDGVSAHAARGAHLAVRCGLLR